LHRLSGGRAATGLVAEDASMKTRSQGTTLMELMTALAVLGILVGIAVPSFRFLTADARASAFTNDLITALHFARSTALQRSSSVSVCASSNQTSCTGSGTWGNGWIAYEDLNANNLFDSPGEPILRVWTPASSGVAVTVSGGAPRVTYNAMGMGAQAAAIQFNFVPSGCTGNRQGRTDVLVTGAVRSSKVACP
jgi:type IV fimbrial biogenesis protein FimT